MSGSSAQQITEMAAEIERLRDEVEKLREEKHELCIEGYRSDTQAIRDAGFWATNALNEMAAEIERQADPRDKLALAQHATLIEAMAEIERLRARVAELESHLAITFGTLAQPTPDRPTKIEHNIPPSAPPHDE